MTKKTKSDFSNHQKWPFLDTPLVTSRPGFGSGPKRGPKNGQKTIIFEPFFRSKMSFLCRFWSRFRQNGKPKKHEKKTRSGKTHFLTFRDGCFVPWSARSKRGQKRGSKNTCFCHFSTSRITVFSTWNRKCTLFPTSKIGQDSPKQGRKNTTFWTTFVFSVFSDGGFDTIPKCTKNTHFPNTFRFRCSGCGRSLFRTCPSTLFFGPFWVLFAQDSAEQKKRPLFHTFTFGDPDDNRAKWQNRQNPKKWVKSDKTDRESVHYSGFAWKCRKNVSLGSGATNRNHGFRKLMQGRDRDQNAPPLERGGVWTSGAGFPRGGPRLGNTPGGVFPARVLSRRIFTFWCPKIGNTKNRFLTVFWPFFDSFLGVSPDDMVKKD